MPNGKVRSIEWKLSDTSREQIWVKAKRQALQDCLSLGEETARILGFHSGVVLMEVEETPLWVQEKREMRQTGYCPALGEDTHVRSKEMELSARISCKLSAVGCEVCSVEKSYCMKHNSLHFAHLSTFGVSINRLLGRRVWSFIYHYNTCHPSTSTNFATVTERITRASPEQRRSPPQHPSSHPGALYKAPQLQKDVRAQRFSSRESSAP